MRIAIFGIQFFKNFAHTTAAKMASSIKLAKPRHILDLNPEEKIKFLESIDVIFSDIDGVLWNQLAKVDGAPDGYKALSKAGKKYYFITNNSARSEDNYNKAMKANGMDVDYADIIHPAKSVVKYLININFDGLIYCIGTEGFKGYLRRAGFKIIDGPTKILEESFTDLAKYIFDKEPVRAVIVDVDFNLSGAKLTRAHQYLKHPDCIFISGATDMMLPVTKDIKILGPGPYVKVLEEASGRTPITLAKPGKELAEMLVDKFNIKDRNRALMIGDMLQQDIGFGKAAGFKTLLVLSGGCSKQDMLNNTNVEQQPDYYAESMFDFVKFFENSKL